MIFYILMIAKQNGRKKYILLFCFLFKPVPTVAPSACQPHSWYPMISASQSSELALNYASSSCSCVLARPPNSPRNPPPPRRRGRAAKLAPRRPLHRAPAACRASISRLISRAHSAPDASPVPPPRAPPRRAPPPPPLRLPHPPLPPRKHATSTCSIAQSLPSSFSTPLLVLEVEICPDLHFLPLSVSKSLALLFVILFLSEPPLSLM